MSLRDKYTDEEWWELVEKLKTPNNKTVNNSLDNNYQNLLKDIINNGGRFRLDPNLISYDLYKKLYSDFIQEKFSIEISKFT